MGVTTPVLSNTTTYYVEQDLTPAPQNVGPVDNTFGGGGNYQFDQHLVFDVYAACTLTSVKVYATGAGNRTVFLRNSSGAVLQSATINIPDGESRIILNFPLTPGTDFELGANNDPDLYRNNTGTNYPYTLSGLVSITRSSAQSNPVGYYYYYYDWEIQAPGCISDRSAVTANVGQVPFVNGTSTNATLPSGNNGAIDLQVIGGVTPISYAWSNGATTEDLQNLAPGVYDVTVTDAAGCSQSASVVISLDANCEAVSTISHSNLTPTSVRLNWVPTTNAHHYEIRGRAVTNSTWTTITIAAGSPNIKNVFGLGSNNSYIWQIKSWCNAAETLDSPWSDLDTFTTVCAAPDSIWTSPVSGQAAQLNWTAVSGAEGYEIRGRNTESPNWVNILVGSFNTSKQVLGLTPGTTYEWMVRTWCDANGVNKSSYTSLDQFTTTNAARLGGFNSGASLEAQFSASIFPNPTIGFVRIELATLSSATETQLSIFDLSSKLIENHSFSSRSETFDFNHLSAGVYYLQLESGKHVWHEKLIITK